MLQSKRHLLPLAVSRPRRREHAEVLCELYSLPEHQPAQIVFTSEFQTSTSQRLSRFGCVKKKEGFLCKSHTNDSLGPQLEYWPEKRGLPPRSTIALLPHKNALPVTSHRQV